MNDTDQQGCKVKATLKNLELARNEKGPMSSRNLSFTIEQTEKFPDLKPVLKKAIYNNATDFLNPPIKNLGYKGIEKTANEIKKWFKESKDVTSEFQTLVMLIERAGTGGALFRNLYRDFLKEAYELTEIKEFKNGYTEFIEHSRKWTEISNLFLKVGETKDEKYVNRASKIFIQLSKNEKKTMEKLKEASV